MSPTDVSLDFHFRDLHKKESSNLLEIFDKSYGAKVTDVLRDVVANITNNGKGFKFFISGGFVVYVNNLSATYGDVDIFIPVTIPLCSIKLLDFCKTENYSKTENYYCNNVNYPMKVVDIPNSNVQLIFVQVPETVETDFEAMSTIVNCFDMPICMKTIDFDLNMHTFSGCTPRSQACHARAEKYKSRLNPLNIN
jgi:hypothetical protein